MATNGMSDIDRKRIDDEIEYLAKAIFCVWDTGKEGVILAEDILQAAGLDVEFGLAIGRVLGSNENEIYWEDLAQCLRVLMYGDLQAKVALLFQFMDQNEDSTISYSTVQSYMKIEDNRIYEKLGFIDKNGNKVSLGYKEILSLFANSIRGEEAIDIFCRQILSVLTKHARDQMRLERGRQVHANRPNAVCTSLNLRAELSAVVVALRDMPHVLYFLFLIGVQVLLWLYNVNHYHSKGYPVTFCFAKGFGLNLRLLTIALYFTMARSTLGALNYVPILSYIRLIGFNAELHSFCGFCTAIHAVGHTIMHIIYQMKFRNHGFTPSFYQKSLFLGYSWNNALDGDAITGFLLLFSILAMSFSALCRGLSSKAYSYFSQIHFLYITWVVLIFLHVPTLWPYFLGITLLMILDRGYDFMVLTIHSTLIYSRPCSNGVTYLSVPYARSRNACHPGSYYRIKVPAISATEWHPLSLAGSSSSHNLTFFVASAGDWTKELHRIVSHSYLRSVSRVMVQGPFDAPARDALNNPNSTVLLVASGIGITPFFSVMATKVKDEYVHESDRLLFKDLFQDELSQRRRPMSASTVQAMQQSISGTLTSQDSSSISSSLLSRSIDDEEHGCDYDDAMRPLHVLWSIRDPGELLFYLDYVFHLVKNQNQLKAPVVYVDVYLTGLGKTTDPMYMVSQTLFLLALSGQSGDYMRVRFGRMNILQVMHRVSPDEVYFCGGSVLETKLNKICYKYGVKFLSERFDSISGKSIVESLLRFFSSPPSNPVPQRKRYNAASKNRQESLSSSYYSGISSNVFDELKD